LISRSSPESTSFPNRAKNALHATSERKSARKRRRKKRRSEKRILSHRLRQAITRIKRSESTRVRQKRRGKLGKRRRDGERLLRHKYQKLLFFPFPLLLFNHVCIVSCAPKGLPGVLFL